MEFTSRKSAVGDGVWLHHVSGGAGVPVVLLHGFPQSWYMWRKVMPALAEQFHVIAPDLRGCGDSEKQSGPYDGWTLAGDVHGLLELLGVDQPVYVVGHDMGAPVALSYAARYPEATRALVYIDEPVFGINLEQMAAFSPDIPNMVWWWPFHQPLLAETVLAGHERAYFDFFVFSKTHATNLSAWTEQDKEEYVRHLREMGGVTGALGGYRDVFVTEERLAPFKTHKLTIPTLGITGEFGLPDVADALGGYIEEVEAAEIADSGHFVAEERPEALVDLLTGFFARHGG
jgi:pimeloyl-ACP methyl ester carboxylesterase